MQWMDHFMADPTARLDLPRLWRCFEILRCEIDFLCKAVLTIVSTQRTQRTQRYAEGRSEELKLVAALLRCATSVFSVSLWRIFQQTNNHRDTENTEVAQRSLKFRLPIPEATGLCLCREASREEACLGTRLREA